MGNCLGQCLAGKTLKREFSNELNEELVHDNDNKQNHFIFKIMKFKKKTRKNIKDNFWDNKDLSYSRLNRSNQASSSEIQLQSLDAQNLIISAKERLIYKDQQGIASSSPASSSLDLEWEHEYSNSSQVTKSWFYSPDDLVLDEEDRKLEIQKQNSLITMSSKNINVSHIQGSMYKMIPNTTSKHNWSHISTPESMEWDIDEEQQKQLRVEDDRLDHETLELLHQIEQLKIKVLKETGSTLQENFLQNYES